MKQRCLFLCLIILMIVFMGVNVFEGSVHIPFQKILHILVSAEVSSADGYIIWYSRIPQMIVALFSGMALAVSGLYLQTLFANPLADSSILGIQSGAGLGAAIVFLLTGGSLLTIGSSGLLLVVMASFLCAIIVILVLLFVSTLIRSNVILLIMGVMLSYMVTSIISLLSYMAEAESLRMFFVWGMGSFSTVSVSHLWLFCSMIIIGLIAAAFLLKPMNALLMGNNYASNLGISIKRTRLWVLMIVGWLSALITAFCGPIAFVGLTAPHIARILFRTGNHLCILPASMLIGALMTLLCNWCSSCICENTLLPINIITPFISIPIIIYVIINKQNRYS